MYSSKYLKYQQSGKPAGSPVEERGTVANKDKMSFIGGKVPANLSLHGSNTLRGGRKTFNPMCLNDNWFEDRLNPDMKKEIDLFTAADDRPPQAQYGPWATEYMTAYSKGNWRHEKVKQASTTIFAIDETGSRDWTSCYRNDYRNPQQEEGAIRRMCADEGKRKADDAEERLRAAAEARKPEWPLTPEVAARISAERDAAGDAQSHHQKRSAEEHFQQQQEEEEARQERALSERYYSTADEPRGTKETPMPECNHSCAYHRPVTSRKEYTDAANALSTRMQGLDLSQEACRPAGLRRETVRFVDCFSKGEPT